MCNVECHESEWSIEVRLEEVIELLFDPETAAENRVILLSQAAEIIRVDTQNILAQLR